MVDMGIFGLRRSVASLSGREAIIIRSEIYGAINLTMRHSFKVKQNLFLFTNYTYPIYCVRGNGDVKLHSPHY